MKKLFICAALISCSFFVVAQRQHGASFRNYLNNSKPLPLNNPGVFSQLSSDDTQVGALMNGSDMKIKEIKRYLEKGKEKMSLLSKAYASVLPNGNIVYQLRQDNLPCVVPDLSAFNMPVAKGNNLLDNRINGSYP